jgi:Kef-type K+ transport system membrane component KefB
MAGEGGELLLAFVLVLAGAKLGGEVFRRIGQPALIGEILVGLTLGPSLLDILPDFSIGVDHTPTAEVLLALAQIGVLLLLFEVGLETDIKAFQRVGVSAGLVGFLGVAFSLVLGILVSYALTPYMPWVISDEAVQSPILLHVFIGAALTATSVGITAQVLRELGRLRSPESQIILGAAVFDDVLGLIVLAIVSGLVGGAALSPLGIAWVFVASLGFFIVAIVAGAWFAPRMMRLVHRFFKADYAHLGFAVLFMFVVSYLATLSGLAAIVGAFAAGLALSRSEHHQLIFEQVRPVGSLFVGFFFVVLGARIDLREAAGDTGMYVVAAGLLLTVVGILAKLAAGLGVVGIKASRYVVGVGMVPRGEVGLIFAVFGLEHGLVTNWQYTSIVLVVLLTTLVTPIWLKSAGRRFTEPTESAAPRQASLAGATEP